MELVTTHLRFPIRITAAGAATVEDESDEEMVSIALYAVTTPRGHRPEAPDFGYPVEPAFQRFPEPVVTATILTADERIATLATETRSRLASDIIEEVRRL